MDLSLAVRKDWPLLRDILQKAMDSISEAEMRTIHQHWTNPKTALTNDRFSSLGVSVAVLGGLCLALLVTLLIFSLRSTQGLTSTADRGSESAQETNRHLQVNRRKILINSALSLVITALVATSATNFLLYRQAFELKRKDLMQIVSSQARLIDAVARFDRKHSNDVGGGAAAATFAQVIDAHENTNQIGKTGEFIFAYLEGDMMVFPMRPRYYEQAREGLGIAPNATDPMAIPFTQSSLAEPMRRALSGKRGTMVGTDYRGVRVLAAYEPSKKCRMESWPILISPRYAVPSFRPE